MTILETFERTFRIGGSREAQMASAVDGLLWRTGGEDGALDGDDDGAQKMGATDREGNLLLPLNPHALCSFRATRTKLCPNSTSRRVSSPLSR